MLKARVIPTLLYKNHGLVKGRGFDSWRRVGTALPAIKVYGLREVDELILVDIAATPERRCMDLDDLDALADECFMPLTAGGGVTCCADFRALLRAGADKVAVNSGAVRQPALVQEAAALFGTQCVVVSIDVRGADDRSWRVCTECGTRPTERHPVEWAREVERLGAGEILLTSVERDGTMGGYDLPLIRSVAHAVRIPVIASGGAGSYEDFRLAIAEGGASAVAAASIFHFTQQTPLEAKRYLAGRGIPVRV